MIHNRSMVVVATQLVQPFGALDMSIFAHIFTCAHHRRPPISSFTRRCGILFGLFTVMHDFSTTTYFSYYYYHCWRACRVATT
mmetsp:Transcript_28246/g.39948  ORF Transcript_28246/g.39948 Transcript_28246/m.39948 type:complete len:83 (+) Transcript_28246:539-787(+)